MKKLENRNPVLGSIIGDIVGSRFELNNCRKKDFDFMPKGKCRFTDDSVMTLAVAKSIIDFNNDFDHLKELSVENMVSVGRNYKNCGYGRSFYKWIMTDNHEPYGSYGNGAAMRISSIPFILKDEEAIKKAISIVTNVSHNHPDAVEGAEAVAMAIHLALSDKTKEDIKSYIEQNYYKINISVEELSKTYKFQIKCSETVKPALQAFYESIDFEDAIRNAISIGGDSDTIASITGGIAAAYYGIPEDIKNRTLEFLDENLLGIYNLILNKQSGQSDKYNIEYKEFSDETMDQFYNNRQSFLELNAFEITEKILEKINYDNVIAVEYSDSIIIVEKENNSLKLYTFNTNNVELKNKVFNKILILKNSDIESDYIREYKEFEDEWVHFFLGMRHHLFIKKKYENLWWEKYTDTEWYFMYVTWLMYLNDIVLKE